MPANATQRYIRGEAKARKPDGLYRAMQRGEQIQARARNETARDARQVAQGAWLGIAKMLDAERHPEIAAIAKQFAGSLSSRESRNEAEPTRLEESPGLPRVSMRQRIVAGHSR